MLNQQEALECLHRELDAYGETFEELPQLQQLIEAVCRYKDEELEQKIEEVGFDEKRNGYVYDKNGQIIGINLNYARFSDPAILSTFSHLTWLRMDFGVLTNIAWISRLTRLTSLELNLKWKPLIEDVSPLMPLTKLTRLILNWNEITDVSPLAGLTGLTTLSLMKNHIRDISALAGLTGLTTLNLGGNRIEDVSALRGLNRLIGLFLWENHITDISPLAKLNGLTELSLGANQIKDVSALRELSNLRILELLDNQITDVSSLTTLTKLLYLDLRKNTITALPKAFIEHGLEIHWKDSFTPLGDTGINLLYNNLLETPPIEIVKKGRQAIFDWFKAQEDEKLPLNEVKVLLVGEGEAGKTSLVKRLLGQGFDPHQPQTNGIWIADHDFRHDDTTIHTHFWDFGGQEIMHATHQFFLTKRSLYLLVLDGRKEEDPDYWLNHIRSFGGDSPILVVLNKMDQHPAFDVDRVALQRKYPNIQGFYRVSCLTNDGIEQFSADLVNALLRVELVKQTWAKRWFTIKTRLEQMTDPFIRYDDYLDFCRQEHLADGSSEKTLLGYLHDLGVVVHFDDVILEDMPVLQPEWVTQGVYRIMICPELEATQGELPLQQIKTMLSPQDYPRATHHYLIKLMKKFELCYELDTTQDTILIPGRLPIQEPAFEFDYAAALQFQLWYQEFLPPAIMPRFIVRLHGDIRQALRWRTGVVLERWQTTAVVRADYAARKIFIFVHGEQKRDYLSVIRKTFEDIHATFEKLDVDERVCLPDQPNVTVSLVHLLALEQDGERTYRPEHAKRKYDVCELLGMVIAQDEARLRHIEELAERIDCTTQQTQQTAAAIKGALDAAFQGLRDNIAALKAAVQKHTIDEEAFCVQLTAKIEEKLYDGTLADFAETQTSIITKFPHLQEFFKKPAPNIEKYRRFLLTAEYLLPRLKYLNLDGAVVIVEYAKLVEAVLQEQIGTAFNQYRQAQRDFTIGKWLYAVTDQNYQQWIVTHYANAPDLCRFLTPSAFTLTQQALENLKTNLPAHALQSLEYLKGQAFASQHDFTLAIEQQLGKPDADKYTTKHILPQTAITGLTTWTEQIRILRNDSAHNTAYGEPEARQMQQMLLIRRDNNQKTLMEWLLQLVYYT